MIGPRPNHTGEDDRRRFHLHTLRPGAEDLNGEIVTRVYVVADDFAIYSTRTERVSVLLSDDVALARQQRSLLAPLVTIRNQITATIGSNARISTAWKGLRGLDPETVERCKARVADGIATCLDGETSEALRNLRATQEDLDRQLSAQNVIYITCVIVSFQVLVCFILVSALAFGSHLPRGAGEVIQIVASGALGGSTSYILSRNRLTHRVPIAWSLGSLTLRLSIGVIGALIGTMVLRSGLIADIRVGETYISGPDTSPNMLTAFAFLLGFAERATPSMPGETAATALVDAPDHAFDVSEFGALRRDIRMDLGQVPDRVASSISETLQTSFSLPEPVNFRGVLRMSIAEEGGDSAAPTFAGEQQEAGPSGLSVARVAAPLLADRTYRVTVTIVGRGAAPAGDEGLVSLPVDIRDGRDSDQVPFRLSLDVSVPGCELAVSDIVVPSNGTWSADAFRFRLPELPDPHDGISVTVALSQSGLQWGRAMAVFGAP